MVLRLYKQLGQTIRTRRDNAGMTQEDLAKAVRLSRTSVTNIERGRQQLLVHQLLDFAAALKAQPHELLDEIKPANDVSIEAAIEEVPPEVQKLVAQLRKAPAKKAGK